MIVTSFYTNSLYKEYAKRLEESARAQGIETDIVELDGLGCWRANACQIPTFIKTMMAHHGGESILFLHADSLIRSFPDLLIAPDRLYFAGAYFSHPDRPRSSTLWFRSCEESIALLDHWDRLIVERHPNEPDFVLPDVMRKQPGVRFMTLPASYAWNENEMRRRHGDVRPVIEHFHASGDPA